MAISRKTYTISRKTKHMMLDSNCNLKLLSLIVFCNAYFHVYLSFFELSAGHDSEKSEDPPVELKAQPQGPIINSLL